MPLRRQSKNPLDSKHGVIRSIIYLQQSAHSFIDSRILAIHAVGISNSLYWSDLASSFELAKGYTKPLLPNIIHAPLPEEIAKARDKSIAKDTLTKILRSNTKSVANIHPGDRVQLFMKQDCEKGGKCSPPQALLSIDTEVGIARVPGSGNRTIHAALEDTRAAVIEPDLAMMVRETIDQFI